MYGFGEHCTQHVLKYDKADGHNSWRSLFGLEYLGFLKTTPEHIEEAVTESTAGFYLAQYSVRILEQARGIKSRNHNVDVGT
jgi:hypothetical protein